jgi:hypothetical protein
LSASGQSVRKWHALGRVAARQLRIEEVVDGRLCRVSPIMKLLGMAVCGSFVGRGGSGGSAVTISDPSPGGSPLLVLPASAGCRGGPLPSRHGRRDHVRAVARDDARAAARAFLRVDRAGPPPRFGPGCGGWRRWASSSTSVSGPVRSGCAATPPDPSRCPGPGQPVRVARAAARKASGDPGIRPRWRIHSTGRRTTGVGAGRGDCADGPGNRWLTPFPVPLRASVVLGSVIQVTFAGHPAAATTWFRPACLAR